MGRVALESDACLLMGVKERRREVMNKSSFKFNIVFSSNIEL